MAKKDRETQAEQDLANSALESLRADLPEDKNAGPVDDYDDDPGLEGELLDDDQADDADDAGEEIPDELVFTTSDKPDDDADDRDRFLKMRLDDDVLYAQRPSKGAWTLLLGSVSRSADQSDRTQAMLDVVFSVFDEQSQYIIKQRLLNPGDRFDADDLAKIMETLIRKWAPNPSAAERMRAMRNGAGVAHRNGSGNRRQRRAAARR